MADLTDSPPSVPPAAPAPPAAVARFGAWRNPWLIVALLALGLAGWQWVETRLRLADTQQELARRLSESDALARESRALAKQANEQLAALQEKYGELDAKFADSKSQQATLENLYQELARGRDDSALAEVEQGVTLAAQQLQLAANVQGAVLALQAAEARLASTGRPQFIALRKVLTRDLDRLRALPQIDLPGMNGQLESVISAVDTLPLAVDGRPRDERPPLTPAVAASAASPDFWRQLAAEFWGELRGLIRIQRFDRDEPALLAPQQVFFLRENLKLRLLNARLALLTRDQWTFRNELKQALFWLERYFDGRDPALRTAQRALHQLAASEINSELPNLNESLSAIRSLKLGRERR